ncbi:Protein of unknown function DUF4817 [Trinorchestia longiramus]|nr:Protein of unknown function DUF4817 [Trinorchestia longiramus]
MQLTTEQRVFVVTTYVRTGSIKQVQHSFAECFPDRRLPCLSVIQNNIRKYQTKGTCLNLNKGCSGRRKTVRTEENTEMVRTIIEENETVSCRKNNSLLSKSSFNRIVKRDLKWYPYKMHLRHQLTDNDYVRRENFVRWFLRKPDRFIDNIISDEAAFFMNGEVNNHNVRKYAPQNNPPEWNFEKSICQDKLSLWIGLCGNGSLVGPLFYDNNLYGVAYLDLINEAIVLELRHIYANRFNRLWWFQDGAPAHRLLVVKERLRELFGTRIVALSYDIEWPPRSPDLTPCDYFLWRYLKNKVYCRPPENINQLREKIKH